MPAILWNRAARLVTGSAHELDSGGIAACRHVLAVYLTGYFLMYVHWMQLGWLAGGLFLIRPHVDWTGLWKGAQQDTVMLSFTLFLAWMSLRSLLAAVASPWAALGDAGAAVGGMLWLAAFAVVVWQSAVNLGSLEAVGAWIGAAATLAAVVSFLMFYFVLPDHFAGERLSNWFVYGGLNPVCTALTFGFAAIWVVCVKGGAGGQRRTLLLTAAQVILLLAVLFTRSRGALMALVAGHLALTVAVGWRNIWRDWLVLAAVVLVFQLSGPWVTALAQAQAKGRAVSEENIQFLPTVNDPMKELLTRADSGRLEIYRAGIGALPNAAAWIFGIGQWGTDASWRSKLPGPESPPHLHSAILATIVQGGLIGLALLLVPLALGFRRAWMLAGMGHPTWLALLAFGCAGLLFDGQSFTRMNTLPLFEPLLVLFPLLSAASGWVNARAFSSSSCRPL